MDFSFKLKGKDWFGLYLAAMLLYFVPMILLQFLSKRMQNDPANLIYFAWFFVAFAFSALSLWILITPIIKKFMNNTYLNGNPLNYSGKILEFVFLNIGNTLLTVITFGIYFPWYFAKLWKYLLRKTCYNGSSFEFGGSGSQLFLLLLATLFAPMILYGVGFALLGKVLSSHLYIKILSQIGMYLILIPYAYFIYKWMVNISFKSYKIRWETQAIASMIFLLKQFVLTIFTIGIYSPVATAKCYEYFTSRTSIFQADERFILNAKFNYATVWKFVWTQILLTLVTCGIYGAWAYCKVMALFIDNTSIVRADGVRVARPCE